MKWKWCEMCHIDGHCENQDRNMECACYAREQTLRAEQYSNVIDELDKRLKKTQELELEVRRENEKLKDLLEKAMDDVYQMSLVNEDSRELLMQIQEVLK